MEKPMHKHFKCSGCKFLGSLRCESTWFDMYCCGSTIVVRWDDHVDDHFSGNYIGFHRALDALSVEASIETPDGWWPAFRLARRIALFS